MPAISIPFKTLFLNKPAFVLFKSILPHTIAAIGKLKAQKSIKKGAVGQSKLTNIEDHITLITRYTLPYVNIPVTSAAIGSFLYFSFIDN